MKTIKNKSTLILAIGATIIAGGVLITISTILNNKCKLSRSEELAWVNEQLTTLTKIKALMESGYTGDEALKALGL